MEAAPHDLEFQPAHLELSDTYPLDAHGKLCLSLQHSWGVDAEWKKPVGPTGWWKAAVDNRLSAMGRLSLVTTLLTTLAGSAIVSPMASYQSWPGNPLSFHIFLGCISASFLFLLTATLISSLIIWFVQREFSVDEYVTATGKLDGFQVGFGALHMLRKFTNDCQVGGVKINLSGVISHMLLLGIWTLLAAFACKVAASVTDDITHAFLIGLFCIASPLILLLSYHIIASGRSMRTLPGLH